MEAVDLNSSLYNYSPEIDFFATAIITARNSTLSSKKISSTVYEWRFLLPPYILIFLLSISGNCLVISTLARNRRLRTVTNVFLINLAISDFLLGVFCLPFTLIGQIYKSFLFGETLCKLIPFIQAVTVSVDVWTLVAISLERYYAICRPLSSRRWQTLHHAYKMIVIVWLFSLFVNVPIVYVSTLQPMKGDAFKCREVWMTLELERMFNIGLDVVLLLIPLCTMILAYARVVTKLWMGMKHEIKHNFDLQSNLSGRSFCKKCKKEFLQTLPVSRLTVNYRQDHEPFKGGRSVPVAKENTQLHCTHTSVNQDFRHAVRSTHINKSIQSKRKVIKMLFVIIMEFFICWVPLHTVNTIYLFYPKELYQHIGAKGVMCFQLLAYCSACCNPITYCFMNKKFRRTFINHLKNSNMFGCCFSEKSVSGQLPLPRPSSQEMTAGIIRSSQSRRSGIRDRRSKQPISISHLVGKKRYYANTDTETTAL